MHDFYKDLELHGIHWEPAYLREEDHTYHFVDTTLEMDIDSVSALKKGLSVPFTKTPAEVVRDAKPGTKYYGADPIEVAANWKNTSVEALAFGHRVHSIIEYSIKGQRFEESAFDTNIRTLFNPIRKNIMEKGVVYTEVPVILPLCRPFGEEMISLATLKSTKKISREELNQLRFKMFSKGLGGTIDILVVDWEGKKFYIYDIKTDKEIRGANKDFPKPMPIFPNIIDCELEVYSFQVWLYAMMIKVITGFEFVWQKSAILHYDKVSNKFIPYMIKNRELEAGQLVKKHFNL